MAGPLPLWPEQERPDYSCYTEVKEGWGHSSSDKVEEWSDHPAVAGLLPACPPACLLPYVSTRLLSAWVSQTPGDARDYYTTCIHQEVIFILDTELL